MGFDADRARDLVDDVWEDDILPALADYIRIPNVSPDYDAGWAAAGHMDRATELVRAWLADRPIDGLTVEVVRLDGRTPVILAEVPAAGGSPADPGGAENGADGADTVLFYGHLDKQPTMEGWRDGLGPWEPVREGNRVYGRGGADDGYAAFASLTAIEAVRAGGGDHTRCVLLIDLTRPLRTLTASGDAMRELNARIRVEGSQRRRMRGSRRQCSSQELDADPPAPTGQNKEHR